MRLSGPGFRPDAVPVASRRGLLSRSFRSAPFVSLLLAYTLSQFSEGMTQTVLTWIAFRLHHNDVALVGRIGLIQTLVPFVILIPVGLLVDALPRSIFMAAITLFKGATYAIIPLLALFEPVRPGLLMGVVLSTSILSAGFGPAFSASLPGFVPADRLKAANGWVQIAGQGGYFLGPLVSAGLLLLVPAQWLLLLSGGGFILSGFFFGLNVPPIHGPEGQEGKSGEKNLKKDWIIGHFRSLVPYMGNPTLILCTVFLAIFGLLNAPMSLLFPSLSAQLYKAPPSFYALLSGAYFLGSFLGGIVLLWRRLPGHFPMIAAGMVLSAGALLLVSSSGRPDAGVILLLLAGLGLSWAQPLVLSRIQMIVPGESLGRVLSLVMTVFLLSSLVGIEGGTLFLRHHPAAAFVRLEGLFLILSASGLLLLVTLFRNRLPS